ncbi:MAG: hypothetical protein ABW168_08255 [Sedimenticola sp.]
MTIKDISVINDATFERLVSASLEESMGASAVQQATHLHLSTLNRLAMSGGFDRGESSARHHLLHCAICMESYVSLGRRNQLRSKIEAECFSLDDLPLVASTGETRGWRTVSEHGLFSMETTPLSNPEQCEVRIDVRMREYWHDLDGARIALIDRVRGVTLFQGSIRSGVAMGLTYHAKELAMGTFTLQVDWPPLTTER